MCNFYNNLLAAGWQNVLDGCVVGWTAVADLSSTGNWRHFSVYYPNPVLLCVPACILHAATKCSTVSVGPLHCLHLGSYRVWQTIAFRHLVLWGSLLWSEPLCCARGQLFLATGWNSWCQQFPLSARCVSFKKKKINTFCINSTQKITGSRPLCLFQMKVASPAATAPPGVP